MFNSPDGTFRIMFVQASRDLPTYKECANWLEAIRQVVAKVSPESSKSRPASSPLPSSRAEGTEKTASIQIGYTGRPAFVAEVAGGMQHDVTASVGGTAVIIAILFYIAHRRWKPMLWLVTLLALILGSTLAIGGLLIGRINVISMGFAAILLGLAVDYAVVHYQEALAHPNFSIQQIRRGIAPSIFWAAVTTICAFLVLNFGGLARPGATWIARGPRRCPLRMRDDFCVSASAVSGQMAPRWIEISIQEFVGSSKHRSHRRCRLRTIQ